MRSIVAVALKEVRQIGRDPFSLIMLLGVPAFMLLLYGYALNHDVRHVPLGIVDRDPGSDSRDLVAAFANSTIFDPVGAIRPGEDFGRVFERRRAQAILVIPEDYGAALADGDSGRIQMVLDGSDAVTASTALQYAAAIVDDLNRRRLIAAGPAGATDEPIRYRPRVWYNPDLESTRFLVPGLIGFILMLTAVVSTALSVVREKERGTLEQLRVTALPPGSLILGKTLPYLAISLIATVIILAAADVLFHVRIAGRHFDLFVAVLIYLLGALGFGLLVSSFSDTQAMAFQVGLVTTMLPAIFLSGFIFPIRSMPVVLQWLTYAVPARYFLVVLRGVILKGAGLAPYGRDMLFLTIYAVVVLAVASIRLTRRET
jgi:ABC-2 type transport system permease protein